MHRQEITIDVEQILLTLGVRNVRAAGNETNYSCPGPSHSFGDHRPSAYMRGTHPWPYICFGCGAQGTIINFVAEFKGVSNSEAWRWLGELCGFEVTYDPESSLAETLNRILGPKTAPEIKVTTNKEIVLGPNIIGINSVIPGYNYMIDRGLTRQTLERYGVKWDTFSGRVAIPYYRKTDGLCIGFKARDISGEHPAKYLVLGDRDKDEVAIYGFKPFNTSLELFGFHQVPDDEYDLIVVEGEMNAMRVQQAGFDNVVGLPTAALSAYQAAILRESFERVTLYLDCDEAGTRGQITAMNMIGSTCDLRIVPDHHKDAMESEDDEIQWLIKNSQNPVTAKLTGGK